MVLVAGHCQDQIVGVGQSSDLRLIESVAVDHRYVAKANVPAIHNSGRLTARASLSSARTATRLRMK